MQNTVSLAQYVKKINGVPMGAKRSMRNMFLRAFGAHSFSAFWHYWNPIWGYYLSRKVMKPLCLYTPIWLAAFLTFLVSGALHDIAISIVKWELIIFFTPWFGLMGALAVLSKKFAISYTGPWLVRAIINAIIICSTLLLTYFVEALFK